MNGEAQDIVCPIHPENDDGDCWACKWPEPEGPRKKWKVTYEPSFVEDVRGLGLRRFPLKAVPDSQREGGSADEQ